MNKLSRSLLAGVFIVSALGLTSITSAMPYGEDSGCWRGGHKMGPGHKHGGRGFSVERLTERLNLSDEQHAQVKVIVEESQQQMSDLGEKMRENLEQLRELTQQSPLNGAEVRKVADAQGDLKADMIVLRAQKRAKINAVLTDDQRAQLKQVRGKRGWHH